jgi:uncharacterized membrane protein YphA (DoxX/SURF4 family)
MSNQGILPGGLDGKSTGAKKTIKPIAAASIAVFVGLMLGVAGVLKIFDFAKFANYYADAAQPRWVFFGSGIVEILAGAAMLVPRFRQQAAWALLGMIFLICWAPWKVHELFFLIPQTVAILLLISLVWPLRPR